MSPSARPHLIIGAYAALPTASGEQEEFYSGLAALRPGNVGLEIPFRDGLGVDAGRFAAMLAGRLTGSVITLIPGTMMRLAHDPSFGLASPDADGRAAAVAYVREALDTANDLNQRTGERSVARLHLHSAPSITADADALARSLGELGTTGGTNDVELVVEHCDAYHPEIAGEKRFLALAAELPIAREAGIRMTVNWGRSAVEAHSADRPAEHIATLAAAGLLAGVMFSGAGPSDNRFGGPWADAHLPLAADEPTSLLDAAAVTRCVTLAGAGVAYLGAKIQAPGDASVARRLDMIRHITDLL
ncbi:MAG TPA: DUF4862 family protein [Mycobacterium sp.]